MSNTIDERVVKMQFDNASFEKNVQTSLSTLANLKSALNFGKIDMSGIASNIEKITDKVTGMGGIWETVLSRINNKIVDVGQNIAKEFVINPPTDGFKEYELKMDSLKVIMESSKAGIDEVNKYLNELNTYSDQTIYSFSDMTNSIGKFTNNGVKLDVAVNAIKGIANEAALAGANTQQASHAMYNFAQALSSGSVKLIDWKSIENANMGTAEFKQTLIDTATALGTLKKSGDQWVSTTTNMQGKTSEAFDQVKGFNDSLQAQWMTTDVLTTALELYSTDVSKMTDEEKKAYEEKLIGIGYTKDQIEGLEQLGIRATKAATEVRTFSAMMDALKEAVGSGWAQTWEIIFGNMEEATEMWTAINDVLSGFIGKFSDARNAVLQDWKDLGGRTKLLEGLANVFHILGNVIQPIKDAITLVFPPLTGKTLANITNKFAEFTGKIREVTEFFPMKLFGWKEEKEVDKITNEFQQLKGETKTYGEVVAETTKKAEKDWGKVREAAKKVINGEFGNDNARKDALKKAGFDPDEIQAYVDKVHELSNGTWDLSDKTFDAVEKSLGAVEKTEKAAEKTAETAKKTTESTDDVAKSADKTAKAYAKAEANAQRTMNAWYDKTMDITEAGNLLTLSLASGMSGVVNIFKSAGQVLGIFGKAWKDSFSGVEITMGHLVAFDEAMRNFADKMTISKDALDSFYFIFRDAFSLLKNVRDNVIKFVISILPTVLDLLSNIISTGGNILHFLASAIGLIQNLIRGSGAIRLIFGALTFVFKEVGSALSFVIKVLGYFGRLLSKAVGYVDASVFRLNSLTSVGTKLSGVLDTIAATYTKLKNKLAEKIGFASFDEFTEKADKVVEKIKNFIKPAFDGLIKSLTKFFNGNGFSFDFFSGLQKGFNSLSFNFGNASTIKKNLGNFYKSVKENFGDIAKDFQNIFGKKKGISGVLDKIIPFKKEKTFSEKAIEFYRSVTKNFKEIFSSFTSIFKLTYNPAAKFHNGGIIEASIPLKREKESVSKIINFFNKARELIHNAVSGLLEKLTANKKKQSGLSGIFDFSSLNQSNKKSSKPLDNLVKTIKSLKDKLSKVDIGEALKKAFSFTKTKLIPNAIQFICDMFGKFEMFVAKLDFKKLLLAAKTARTIVKIFNGIKLAKSFSGMADSIGGFFDSLGGRFGKKEESKSSSFLKIAASLALVAKAISIIASIPEDRLDSSVGVVAGIAVVITGIAIALSKIKTTEGSDIGGATKYALAMAISVLIIAKALQSIAEIGVWELQAAEEAIILIVAVMTAATYALSRMKNVKKSAALGPLGFALALRHIAKTIAYIGRIPDNVLEKGKKNISKIGMALALAMVAMGFGHFSAATVAAPIAFAAAVFILATQVVALGLLPTKTLIKGAAAVKFLENTIKSAMKGLTQLKGLGPKIVAAPLAFAAAIFILGLAVAKLGDLPILALVKGMVAVIFISAILVDTMQLLKKSVGDGKFDNSTLNGLIAMALSIFVVGLTVAKLGELKVGALAKGIIAVGFIGAILSACVIFISKYAFDLPLSTIVGLVVITAMLSVLAFNAAMIGFVPLKNVMKGGLVMIAVGFVLTAVSILLSYARIDPVTIGALIPITASLVVLATTAAMIGFVPLGKLIKGVLVLGAVATILVVVARMLSFAIINPSTIFGLIPVVLSLVVLSMTAALIGMVPLSKLLKGILVITLIATLLTISMVLLTYTRVPLSTILGFIIFIAAIVVLADTALLLGAIPTSILVKGTAVILAIGLMLTAAMLVIGNAQIDLVKVAAVLAFMASIQLLCFSVLSMGVLPIPVLAKGLGVITILSTILIVALRTMGSTNFGIIDVVAPLVLVAAILTLAYAVVQIGSIDTGTLIKGTVVIGLIMAGIVIALKELSTIMGQLILMTAAIPGLMAFVGVIGVLAYIVTLMGSLSVGHLAKGLIGLVVVIGAMVVAFKMLGSVSAQIMMVGAAFMMFGIAATLVGDALIKVATAMLIFTQALMMFTTLKADEQFTGLAAGMAILGTVLLVFIGIIVGFVAALYLMPALIIPLLAFGVAILMIGTGINLLVSAIAKFIVIAALIGPALVAAISSIASSAGQILSAIGDAISGAIDYIVKNAPVFMEKAGKLIKSAVSGISKQAPNIKKKVGEAITKAIDWIKKNFPKWLEAGGELIKKIVAGIVTHAPKVLVKIGELLVKAIDAIKRNLPKWLSMGKELVGKLISGLLSLGGKLASEAGHLGKKAVEALKHKVSEWRSVGRNMVSGLISGIMSRASEVANKARNLVSNAIDAAKNKLDSHSPSRVFIQIGKDIDNGLMIGMDTNADKVAYRSAHMAETVIDAAKKPLDTLADLFGSDLVTDPTITPTIDLSEIQNDTKRLYSMMSDMDRFSFHGNLDLATSTNRSVDADRRRKENAETASMDALIGAINGLASLIGNTGNTYNVNGVTYDDGSNISSAVRSLIHAVTVEGRA